MMAIEKNNFKGSRFDSEFSESMTSDEEAEKPISGMGGSGVAESVSGYDDEDDDDEFDDADSGAGSDDFDLLELGETGAELCQVGNQTCNVPYELYDLPGLEDILSVDVWNECLTEEQQFELAKYLPDMDQETFMRTLTELFTGGNFHFGSPLKKLFEMMKGGFCEPRVALYRQGFNFIQKRKHYHLLRKYQNRVTSKLHQIRGVWVNYKTYSIPEKLQVLNIMESQKSLMNENMEGMGIDSSEGEEYGDVLWSKKSRDKKLKNKMGRHSDMDFTLRGHTVPYEQVKYGKQNPKGKLKMAGQMIPYGKDLVDGFPRHNKPGRYGMEAGFSLRGQMRYDDDDMEDPIYGTGVHRGQNASYSSSMDKAAAAKMRKKHEFARVDEYAGDSIMPSARNKNVKQPSDILSMPTKSSHKAMYVEYGKKAKHLEHDPTRSRKRLPPQLPVSDHVEPVWYNKTQREPYFADTSFTYDDQSNKSKIWRAARESPDVNYNYRASSPLVSERYLQTEFRGKSSQEKRGGNFMRNGGLDMARLKGNRMHMRSEETESESSMQSDDDDDENNPLMRRKSSYPSGIMEDHRSSFLKYGNTKKGKVGKRDTDGLAFDGMPYSKKLGDHGEHVLMPGKDRLSVKAKKASKANSRSSFHSPVSGAEEDLYFPGSSKVNDDGGKFYNLDRNGRFQGDPGEKLHLSSMDYPTERKKKRKLGFDPSMSRSNSLHDYVVDETNDLLETDALADIRHVRLGKRGANSEIYKEDRRERSEVALQGRKGAKKRKGKEDLIDMNGQDEDGNQFSYLQQKVDDKASLKRRGKRKLESDNGASEIEAHNQNVPVEEAADVELEMKPQKKQFVLITPTIHTGFSFSVMHLLSAVRMALITPLPEDSLEGGKPEEAQNIKSGDENVGVNKSESTAQLKLPSLTVQEIVNRVRSNPLDPCILDTQEPLQDLVRGVLKIFSSKTAPLGAKGWKALVSFEKSTKSWFWTGPTSQSSSDHETIEEITSPEAWGLPHKTLVKLVDAFANWLKNGQDTLQQIGSLPAPPISLMQVNLDEKERFRDLRAQKSLSTISPSHEEVRAYFRKEEVLRYSIPDRAFAYTAADGKKSIVAPLRRCGGKPTSKARDHFMLKRDRPPHVTILCLVRDAAARLPGSIGTRADVCTLIRDSQYIVEDVSDAQINQVVSGALDRLHYERDPCVQFDGERKLWVYLHRERDEEDFEDDGTASTKKWRRPKKDAAGQSDQGAVTLAYQGTGEQKGVDACSDLNVEPSCMDEDKKEEVSCDDARHNVQENVGGNQGSEGGNTPPSHLPAWEPLDLNPVQDNKSHCQDHSTNEDYDEEAYARESSVGLLGAGLL